MDSKRTTIFDSSVRKAITKYIASEKNSDVSISTFRGDTTL